ncbi:hypothetical protein ACFYOV_17465 [Streptomyces sp. NPDC005931]|uniref:hypothetical protein n=1 Tax=Streptomyces sp. NPDC005931 TaxID=3364737 RepID=UPI0036CCBED6
MRPSHRLTARIAAAALAVAAGLFAPMAATAAPAHAATITHRQSTTAVTGSVSIGLTTGVTITVPGVQLTGGATLDTGVQVSTVTTVTNNTNATLVLSGGGGTSVTVAPGASATVDALVDGTLKIRVA